LCYSRKNYAGLRLSKLDSLAKKVGKKQSYCHCLARRKFTEGGY